MIGRNERGRGKWGHCLSSSAALPLDPPGIRSGTGMSVIWLGLLAHHVSPKNGLADRFAVWVVGSSGSKDAQIQSYSPGGANVPSWEDTLPTPLE